MGYECYLLPRSRENLVQTMLSLGVAAIGVVVFVLEELPCNCLCEFIKDPFLPSNKLYF